MVTQTGRRNTPAVSSTKSQDVAVPATEGIAPGLTPTQVKALGALLAGSSAIQAGKLAGVDRATVARWMASDPDFIAAFNGIRREMLAATRSELRYLSTKAARTLRSLMGKGTPAAIRLRAAQSVLELALAEDTRSMPTDPVYVKNYLEQRAMFRGAGAVGKPDPPIT